jgi:hypothetical protein
MNTTTTRKPNTIIAGQLADMLHDLAGIPLDELDPRDWHGLIGVVRVAVHALDEAAPRSGQATSFLHMMGARARRSRLPIARYIPTPRTGSTS